MKQTRRNKIAADSDSKKGLAVTKGEGWGRTGGEGRRRGLWGIMIGAHGM